jgi:hypothetical protein
LDLQVFHGQAELVNQPIDLQPVVDYSGLDAVASVDAFQESPNVAAGFSQIVRGCHVVIGGKDFFHQVRSLGGLRHLIRCISGTLDHA